MNQQDVPDSLRRELTKELAEGRRLVTAGHDDARSRVEDAKLALGEKGDPTPAGQRARLAAAMRSLLWHRRPDATTCPSDAARIAGGESWRDLMDAAREVAADLSRQGVLAVRQHGADVDIATVVGPIRLARGPRW